MGYHASAWEPEHGLPRQRAHRYTQEFKCLILLNFYLVPTRRRGNALTTRQRRDFSAHKHTTLARREWVTTPARGNQNKPEQRSLISIIPSI